MSATNIVNPQTSSAPLGSLLRNKAFLVFTLGNAVSLLGTAMATIAMPLLVLQVTGSVQQMGVITTLMTMGCLLAAVISGAIVDRFDRRVVQFSCCIISALLFSVIPITWYLVGPSIWLLRIVALPIGFFDLTAYIAMGVGLMNVVSRDQITHASSVFFACQSAAALLGPIIAGYLTVRISGAAVMALNALSFLLLAAALTLLRRLTPSDDGASSSTRRDTFWRNMLSGLQHMWDNRLLFWASVIRWAGLCFTAGAVNLMIYHLQQEALLPANLIGILLSAGAVGGLCGNVLAPTLRERLGFSPLFLGGIALSGAALIGFGISHQVALLFICSLFFSLGDALVTISGFSLRTQVTPQALQGRVFGTLQAMIYAGSGVFIVLATNLAARAGAGVTLALLGGLVILVAAIGCGTPMRYRRPERHSLYPAV
jgi:MFS family permease